MFYLKTITGILLAYLLGSICVGHQLVLLRTGKDLRQEGSGGVGARNAGRLLGWPGFAATLTADFAKGFVTVLLAREFGLSPSASAMTMVAVVAGHVWPITLNFKGGKGVATTLGLLIAYDWRLFLILAVPAGIFLIVRRNFIMSGLAGFALLPCFALLINPPIQIHTAIGIISLIVLFAHRKRIKYTYHSLVSKEA